MSEFDDQPETPADLSYADVANEAAQGSDSESAAQLGLGEPDVSSEVDARPIEDSGGGFAEHDSDVSDSAVGESRVSESRPDGSRVGESRADQARVGESRADQARVGESRADGADPDVVGAGDVDSRAHGAAGGASAGGEAAVGGDAPAGAADWSAGESGVAAGAAEESGVVADWSTGAVGESGVVAERSAEPGRASGDSHAAGLWSSGPDGNDSVNADTDISQSDAGDIGVPAGDSEVDTAPDDGESATEFDSDAAAGVPNEDSEYGTLFDDSIAVADSSDTSTPPSTMDGLEHPSGQSDSVAPSTVDDSENGDEEIALHDAGSDDVAANDRSVGQPETREIAEFDGVGADQADVLIGNDELATTGAGIADATGEARGEIEGVPDGVTGEIEGVPDETDETAGAGIDGVPGDLDPVAAEVLALRGRLAELDELPLEQHPAYYDDLHSELTNALAQIDRARSSGT
jgi:hypothetical protein